MSLVNLNEGDPGSSTQFSHNTEESRLALVKGKNKIQP